MNTENNVNVIPQYPPLLSEPAWVPVAKKVRCFFNNELIANSERVMLKRQFPMTYFFPREDVRTDLLNPGDQEQHKDKWGTTVSHHISVDGKTANNSALIYKEQNDAAPENINNYVTFKWEAMDRWMEEDDEVIIHPRDPYNRIDVCHSSRHVRIEIEGKTVAETTCPMLLFETGLPVRFYIRKSDIDMKLLKPTDHQTGCPYKGLASYYSVVTNGNETKNIAWTYPFPDEEALKIKGLIAFYSENIDTVFIDGKKLPNEKTKWSF